MRCYGCMREYEDEYEICPYCGYIRGEKAEEAIHMEPGTMLSDRYLIGRAVGSGGFGVTYIAWDTRTDCKVAVKEYLPSEFATRVPGQSQVTVFSGDKTQQFNDGLDKFMDEARRLAKFQGEKGIVKIYDSFEENGTAYIIMEFLEGETLASYLEHEGTVPAEHAIGMLMPIMESLAIVHEAGIIHRDIAPDNIYITNTGDVKLIDFGAARFATTSQSRSLSVIVKPGYSPEEQYRSRGDQGPHTDVYALGAVLYKMITGVTPPDAMKRRAQFEEKHKDILEPVSKHTSSITANQETAIMNALNVRVEDRTPDMVALAGELLSDEPVTRRADKIKKNLLYSWPLWLKISVPTALAAICALLVLFLTGVIHFRAPEKDIDLDGMVRVPSVVNYTVEDAEDMLEKKGGLLNLVIGGGEYSSDIDKDKIFMQTPDAASKVYPGTEIQATISYGAESKFMIDVTGYSKELAQQELEALGFVVEFKEEASEDAPGTVIGQSIAPDQKAAQGETIVLTISSGSNENIDTSVEITVPNVVGMSVDKAKVALKKVNLFLSVDSTIHDSNQATGVVQQAPGANMLAYQGDTVSVVVNTPNKIYMPPVEGKTLDQAIQAIEDAGLTYGSVSYEENDGYGDNCVIRANYQADTELKSGTKINLVVNKSSNVSVPDVRNMSQSDAVFAIKEANLVAKVVEEASDKPKGTVLRQTPSQLSRAEKQSTVTIYVSTGSADSPAQETTRKVTLTGLQIQSMPTQTKYYIGDGFKNADMSATANYSDGSSKTISASQLKVENFSSSSAGNKTVSVSYTDGGETQKATFVVEIVKPTVQISKQKITVSEQGTEKATSTTDPSGQTVTWSVSPESVATVGTDGTVKGVKAGQATLTAKLNYNSNTYTSTCKIEVIKKEIPVTNVAVSPSELSLVIGETKSLTPQVTPSNATNGTVTWTVESGSEYASVDSTGKVKGLSAGTAVVVATAGGKTGKCTVKVTAPKASGISVSNSSVSLTRTANSISVSNQVLKPGQKVALSPTVQYNAPSSTIQVTVTPANAGDTSVSVSSNSSAVKAEVQGKTNNVTTIKITGNGEAKSATLTISAKGNSSASKQVTVNVTSDKIQYQSSNTSVATVTGNGEVTASSTNFDSTNITVSVGSKSAICKVTVKGLTSLSVSIPKKTSYAIGESLDTSGITATAKYSDETSKQVTPTYSGFSSSSAGTKTVTASYTEDGVTKTATFTVTVVKLSSITVKAPTKTTYYVGDALDKSGMKVTANYSDGSTKDVTSSCTVSGFSSSSATNSQTVTVSYKEGGIAQSGTFTVSIKQVTINLSKTSDTVVRKPNRINLSAVGNDGNTDVDNPSKIYLAYGQKWNNSVGRILTYLEFDATSYQIQYTVEPSDASVSFDITSERPAGYSVNNTGKIALCEFDGGFYPTSNDKITVTLKATRGGSSVTKTFTLYTRCDPCGFDYSITNSVASASTTTAMNSMLLWLTGNKVGTGRIKFTTTNGLSKSISLECFMIGDGNGDGKVGIGDITLISKYIAGIEGYETIPIDKGRAMDVNMDGQVSQKDINAIAEYMNSNGSIPSGTPSSTYYNKWNIVS